MTILKITLIVFLIPIAYLTKQFNLIGKFEKKVNIDILAMVLIVLYFIFYFILKYTQYYSFIINAFDFSIFDYALFNSAHGNSLHVPFLNGHFFKEHFSPILFLYIPIYFIYSSPINLLFFQALNVSIAAIPLYFIAKKILDKRLAVLTIFIYLNNWFVVYGLLYDFHIEMLMPFLILTMVWAHIERKDIVFWTSLILALACKEDISLYLIIFGLFLIFKEKRRYLGLSVIMVSIFWFFLAFKMISHFNDSSINLNEYKFLSNWREYGQSVGAITSYWLQHPHEIIGKLMTPGVFKLFLPFLFLPLLTTWVIPAIGPIVLNATSSNPLQSSFMLYYAAPIIPFLFIAFIYGWKKIAVSHHFKKIQFIIIALLIALNIHKYIPDQITSQNIRMHQTLKQLQLAGEVSAQANLISHLNYYDKIKALPNIDENTKMIIMDLRGNSFPMSKKEQQDLYERYKKDKNFTIQYENGGLIIFRKK